MTTKKQRELDLLNQEHAVKVTRMYELLNALSQQIDVVTDAHLKYVKRVNKDD